MVMASDDCTARPAQGKPFRGFALALSVRDAGAADRYFAALAEGGEVLMPLARTFWSPRFGMVVDPFGVQWMVSVLPEEREGA